MSTIPHDEEPGFESDVNELSNDQDHGAPETLEENPQVGSEQSDAMEDAQEEAAEERKEGGYQ